MIIIKRVLTVFTILTTLPTGNAYAQSDAYDKVIALFNHAQVVFLGERHWSKQDSDFRISLVKHPDFANEVDDVVIEFGNSLYQNILDDYFLLLEKLPEDELNQVWRNTTQIGTWDSPVYSQFLLELRNINERLPRGSRIRVVAAGPPIDWSKVEVYEDKLPFVYRGWWTVRQIEREVLAKDRKALVITGRGNVQRFDDEMDEEDNEIRRLEALYPEKKFSVVIPMGEVEANAAAIDDFTLQNAPIYIDTHSEPFRKLKAGAYLPGAVGTLKDVADALIYFGVEDKRIRPGDEFYQKHPEYQKELQRRRSLKRRLPPKSYN
ncbi:hypothetical protein GWO43_10715 [candidate division KSB1 bacterium]|nr:hypothetical protein [candidate division KSB1 bacterium]NIR70009.1 hypothetical protein [candidate division KSB1 bacterium]NIS24408.1 hypothetical protein [candidate division KSB1 bacterium]NIT71343.1 hypothetical protein [candidate division KSB1 bacterium]NIU25023.1 hypothetical protein [candidate division KSB1 bacterium]